MEFFLLKIRVADQFGLRNAGLEYVDVMKQNWGGQTFPQVHFTIRNNLELYESDFSKSKTINVTTQFYTYEHLIGELISVHEKVAAQFLLGSEVKEVSILISSAF